jgi:hypothetical protein
MRSYFKKLSEYSPLRFILEASALTIVSRYLIVLPMLIILSIFAIDTGIPNLDIYKVDTHPLTLFLELCILGPLLETWLLQWLPLKILKIFRLNDTARIIINSLLFAYLHLDTGGIINLVGTLPIGFLLNWGFIVQQKKRGTWKAFLIIFAVHGLTNFFPFLTYLLELFNGQS